MILIKEQSLSSTYLSQLLSPFNFLITHDTLGGQRKSNKKINLLSYRYYLSRCISRHISDYETESILRGSTTLIIPNRTQVNTGHNTVGTSIHLLYALCLPMTITSIRVKRCVNKRIRSYAECLAPDQHTHPHSLI